MDWRRANYRLPARLLKFIDDCRDPYFIRSQDEKVLRPNLGELRFYQTVVLDSSEQEMMKEVIRVLKL